MSPAVESLRFRETHRRDRRVRRDESSMGILPMTPRVAAKGGVLPVPSALSATCAVNSS